MKSLAAICLAILALSVQPGQADTLDAFVEEAAQQSLFQNNSAQIALEKGTLPEVKEFARQMIADHERFDKQLRQLGQSQHMAVPTEPSVASKAKQLRLESRDDSFDRIYIDSQAETLEQRLMLFKKEAMSSQNPQLKAFAQSALPSIEKQAKTASDLQEKLKPSAGALKSVDP
jgi:putative membrane protein